MASWISSSVLSHWPKTLALPFSCSFLKVPEA